MNLKKDFVPSQFSQWTSRLNGAPERAAIMSQEDSDWACKRSPLWNQYSDRLSLTNIR